MRNILILLFFASTLTLPGIGQVNSGKIFGVVADSAGNPVRDLTVFIPFTSIGTTTNVSGEYLLENIPPGEVELVFRHVSYLPKTEIFSIKSGESFELNIGMENNVIEMAEIIKKANPANWKFGYEKFKEYVLGDPLGRYCEAENPTDLFFYYDGERLTGHASKPLSLINHYLGYRLVYFLDYFWYNNDITKPDGTVQQASYAFSGSAFYVDRIREGDRHSTQWEENRITEFKGTMQHFLLSAFNNQIIEQGFEVKQPFKNIEDIQKSLNVNKAVAYSRSMEMQKRFYWDKFSNKSIFLFYSPGEAYPIESKITDLNQVPASKSILLKDPILVFHYSNPDHRADQARVIYLSMILDDSGEEPQLIIDYQGNYKTLGGKLLWQYLDTQTTLITALPADYATQEL